MAANSVNKQTDNFEIKVIIILIAGVMCVGVGEQLDSWIRVLGLVLVIFGILLISRDRGKYHLGCKE